MPRFGMDVTLAYPEGYHLMPSVMEAARKNAEEAGVALTETNDMEAAFEDADFLYPKSWGPIMVTEEEAEVEGANEEIEGLGIDNPESACVLVRS